jgi:uncharacterized protein YyaL (SSP411 family)
MNSLANEKSPYLLQHAHNPVDWLPWGEAAFQKAREEDKPIFLSIGYSTCHWCHVMERESFEKETTAQYMNAHFVNIKVDREERPDVDKLYMTFVQATTGQGGWPLSLFLAPNMKPFLGGTYFPPQNAYGRISFPELLERIAVAWRDDRAKVLESSESVLQALERYASLHVGSIPDAADWDKISGLCLAHFQSVYDSKFGGFGPAPKFPRPVAHDFLHRYFLQSNDRVAFQMSRRTLAAMADGGMNDQLGGGFHRYSVDSQWIVSHFEKMLYDQAQLVISYLEMFQFTREEFFADAARSICDYVLRDLTHEGGGFFAGEDADSLPNKNATHKTEGAFYVWTQNEIEEVLDEETAAIFCDYYGVKPDGNAPREGDPHGEFDRQNILYRAKAPDAAVAGVLQSAREKLFAAREKRPRPHRDEKIIVAWNGLMISALARVAGVLQEPKYLAAARCASEFIKRELWDENTRTLRRHFKDGAADVPGFAEDYAFLTRALLDLYEADFQVSDLEWAQTLNEETLKNFWDEENGGLYASAPDKNILLRFKEDYDGAEPSPNSVAAESCVRLQQFLDDEKYREKAAAIFAAFAGRLRDAAPAMPLLLAARLRFDSPPQHIVIVGEKDSADTQRLLQVVRENFLPFSTLILLDEKSHAFWKGRQPFLQEMRMLDDKATAYICHDFACQNPVSRADELRAQLATPLEEV